VQSILESQIDYLSDEIVEGIGLSAEKIESVQLRIADVSTNSMEAYNYFLQGIEEFEKRYFDDSRKFLEKAIELDSTYAVAYLYLAWVYDNLKYIKKELKAYENAKIFSKRATEKERLYIEASYAERIEKLPEKRLGILKQMAKKFPREKNVYISLGSYYFNKQMYKEAELYLMKALELDPEFGRAINLLASTFSDMKNYDKAIEYYNRYSSVFPGEADPFESLGDLYFKLGELNKALESFKKALEIKPEFGSGLRIAYIYALKENYAEAIKWLDHYISTIPSPIQAYGYIWKGIYHSFLGNYKQSLNDISMMQEIMKSAGNEEKIATGSMLKGMIYLDMGEYEKSRNCTEVFYNVAKKNQNLINYIGSIQFLVGFDLMEGKIDSAKLKIAESESLTVKLSKENLYKAQLVNTTLNFVNMELLMAVGSFEGAISVGENLDQREMANFEIEGLVAYNSPFMRDALARAYYYNSELDKAIAEYERLITFDPKSENRRLIHPKYHYRLAKLYEEKGLKEKAIGEFEKFLELWKDADKGIPQTIDAKSRLAELVVN
jgi:tetratricopeptide (TPR) repeat protein